LIVFYKKNISRNCSAWANYNKEDNLINIKNFHGEILDNGNIF